MLTRRLVMLAALAATVTGCAGATTVPSQIAKVGCGMCRFHIPDSRSCYWAIELEGEPYPVVGADVPDHDSHGPDGMCVMDREARVAGRLKRGQFFADEFELLPAQGVDWEATPAAHDHAHP